MNLAVSGPEAENDNTCVEGSQGCPPGPAKGSGPAMTPGSSMNRRTLFPVVTGHVSSRLLTAVLVPALAASFGFSTVRLYAKPADLNHSAAYYYKHGEDAEQRQDYDSAFDNYRKACAKDPKDIRYREALTHVRLSAAALHLERGRKMAASDENQAALTEFLYAAEIDPSNEAVQQEIAKLRTKQGQQPSQSDAAVPRIEDPDQDIASIGSPSLLKPLSNEPISLHMTEDAKVVYQAIGKAAGINVLFDPDFSSKHVQVDLNNVSLFDALRIVGTLTNTFSRPITTNTLFVAQNSRTKHTDLDEQAVQTFYLTNAAQQNDLNDIQTAVRNVLPNAKVYGVAGQNAIVVRGTPDELMLAQKLINDLDKARAEVVIDIAIMEVSKNWERTIGLSWPTSFSASLTSSSSTSSTSSASTTLYTLANANSSNIAVNVGSATLNMLLSDSNTNILQSPRIRATDAQKATMKIGSRIPVATGSYSSTTTTTTSSLVNTQFQYIDVGVNIEVTPTIHYDHDVTLKMKIEVSSESGTTTISDVTEPIISQRVIDQVIRLKEGEASILGGIQDDQTTASWSGIPGLSSIPLLKYLFGSKDHSISNDDLVFVVVPHIVRSQDVNQQNLRPIDTGNGQTISLRRSDQSVPQQPPLSPPASKILPPAPPVNHPIAVAPPIAGIKAETAQAAAPTALQQMREAAQATSAPVTAAPAIVTASPVAAPTAASTAVAAAVPAKVAPAAAVPTLTFALPMPPAAALVTGSVFQLPIQISNGADISSVPLQLKYDPARIELVNVATGDLLRRDGQTASMVKRDDGPGNLTLVVSRPPGSSGVSGSGTAVTLGFLVKTAGPTTITMTRAGILNSNQTPVSASAPKLDLTLTDKK
jgi:general secretion pathway protein D